MQLATLLWPDDSAERAKHNLPQSLYQLRRLLGDNGSNDNLWFVATRQSSLSLISAFAFWLTNSASHLP